MLGQLTLERANTFLTSGADPKTLTIVLPVIIDLETLDLWIDHEVRSGASPKVNAAVFGKMLRGIIDAAGVQATGGSTWKIDAGATDRLDAPPIGDLAHANVFTITMRETVPVGNPANAIHVAIRSGGSTMVLGFAVQWEVAGHTVSAPGVQGPAQLNTGIQNGPWYSTTMLTTILPELSAIASWLNLNDQTYALRIESVTSKQGGAFVSLRIVDTANSDAEYFLGFNTADMRGTPARPQVSYHSPASDPWSYVDDDKNPYTLESALEEILKARTSP